MAIFADSEIVENALLGIRTAIVEAVPDLESDALSIQQNFGPDGIDEVFTVRIQSGRDDVRKAVAKKLKSGFRLVNAKFAPDKPVTVTIDIHFTHYHHFGDSAEEMSKCIRREFRNAYETDDEMPTFEINPTTDANKDTKIPDYEVILSDLTGRDITSVDYLVFRAVPNSELNIRSVDVDEED